MIDSDQKPTKHLKSQFSISQNSPEDLMKLTNIQSRNVVLNENKTKTSHQYIMKTRPKLKLFIEQNSLANINGTISEVDTTAIPNSPEKSSIPSKDYSDMNPIHPKEKKRYQNQRTLRRKKEICIFDGEASVLNQNGTKILVNVQKVEKVSYPSEEYGNSKIDI